MWSMILGASIIFCLRIIDVPAGTLRVIYMVRGQRIKATLLSFVESAAYIFAVVRVLKDLNNPIYMLAYASGYAAGTYAGISLERWIASGWLIARIMSRQSAGQISEQLRQENFGVTCVHGEGREGEVCILFVVMQRKRGPQLLQIVQTLDPNAFITIDPVTQAIGGYISRLARPALLTK